LQAGDLDLTVAAWVYLRDKVSNSALCGKYDSGSNNKEHLMYYQQAGDRFRWLISNNGTATVIVDADNLGSPSATTWYLVIVWHDATANTINIQVNNGAVDSTPHATGIYVGAAAFAIGSWDTLGTPQGPAQARIGPTAMWKSAAGAGGVLDATKRTTLYNAGAGLTYASFTS